MLDCRACVLRSIRAIAGDSATHLHGSLVLTPRISANAPARRRLTTAPAAATKDAFGTSYPPSGRQHPKEESTKTVSNSSLRALQTELKFLTDPVKLASHIHYVLRQNDPAKALDLARLASKSAKLAGDVVVAWNQCVDWHMRSGRVSEAIKIYNEMKKRGVFPDAHTYTLLLRSFVPKDGDGVDEGTVAKATNIYNSMLAPTSRVKPSIIHTNAVLRVCSLAGDMDALWGVVARIPEHGPGSADTITYTILFSAMRYGAMGTPDEGGQYLEQIAGKRQLAVSQGRRIWMECIQKWRSGDLVIDGELVAQMGQLLLISNRMEDWDDVLSLVEQTTKLPRQIVPLDHPDRRIGHVPQITSTGEEVTQTTSTAEDDDGYLPTPANKAFDGVPMKQHSNLIWVQPSNQTLNILIKACQQLRIPKAATAYWNLITSPPYSLKPDVANCQAMLRLYLLNRSSHRAAELIDWMHSKEGGRVSPKGLSYKEAMKVCARDLKNPSIMHNATRIVEDMGKRMKYPDLQTLQAFLSLAMTQEKGIFAALDTLEKFVWIVMDQVKSGSSMRNQRSRHPAEEQLAIAFAKQMASTIQKVTSAGIVPDQGLEKYTDLRNKLNRLISKGEHRSMDDRSVKSWKSHYSDGSEALASRSEREAELARRLGLPQYLVDENKERAVERDVPSRPKSAQAEDEKRSIRYDGSRTWLRRRMSDNGHDSMRLVGKPSGQKTLRFAKSVG